MLVCMVDGRMEGVRDVENRPRIELPNIPERMNEPADDTAGAPMLPPNEIEGQSGETTFRSRDRMKAEEVRSRLTKDGLRGPESLSAQPAVLAASRDALNVQLRDLRLARKSADGIFARFSKPGRDRLATLDREIEETRKQRDEIELSIEELLPKEARSGSRAGRIRAAQEKIGEALGMIAPRKEGTERYEGTPKQELRARREALAFELETLKFWQFVRKQEIVKEMKAIDHSMARIINAERGL